MSDRLVVTCDACGATIYDGDAYKAPAIPAPQRWTVTISYPHRPKHACSVECVGKLAHQAVDDGIAALSKIKAQEEGPPPCQDVEIRFNPGTAL